MSYGSNSTALSGNLDGALRHCSRRLLVIETSIMTLCEDAGRVRGTIDPVVHQLINRLLINGKSTTQACRTSGSRSWVADPAADQACIEDSCATRLSGR